MRKQEYGETSWSGQAEVRVRNQGTWPQAENPPCWGQWLSCCNVHQHLGELVNAGGWGGRHPDISDLAGLGLVLRTCISKKGAADAAAAAMSSPQTILRKSWLPPLALLYDPCKTLVWPLYDPCMAEHGVSWIRGVAFLHPRPLLPTGHYHHACGTSHKLGKCYMNWLQFSHGIRETRDWSSETCK